MKNHTYENIIINPYRGINHIGKTVFFANKPGTCLARANEGTHCAVLNGIAPSDKNPFKICDDRMRLKGYQCIIIKDDKDE